MPELPECETVVRDLRPHVVGRTIGWFGFSDREPQAEFSSIREKIVGEEIQAIDRFGKYIVFRLRHGSLISHLKMTGQWLYSSPVIDKHFRWALGLVGEGKEPVNLVFRDIRRFGFLEWTEFVHAHPSIACLGVDGLSLNTREGLDFVTFKSQGLRKPIKNFLLDQTAIAGAGNIYACEALFHAKVNPATPVSSIDLEDVCMALYGVLMDSIELRGTSVSDYVGGNGQRGSYQNELKVYGREGLPCYVCSTPIEKIVQAGRSTFYCPTCQH